MGFPGSFQKVIDDIKTAQLDVDAAARLIDAESRAILSPYFHKAVEPNTPVLQGQRKLSDKLESLSFGERQPRYSGGLGV
jgi:hypothetical protein